MPDIDSLSIGVEASAKKATSELEKLKGELSGVKNETKQTTAATNKTAAALNDAVKAVSRLSQQANKMGLKNVSNQLKTLQAPIARQSGLASMAKDASKLADQLEKAGQYDLAAQVRGVSSNPLAAENALVAASKAAQEQKQRELEAAKEFANGEKLMNKMVADAKRRAEREKREAAQQTWRETQELLKRQAQDEAAAARASALAEKMRHNKEMESIAAARKAVQEQTKAATEAQRQMAAAEKERHNKEMENIAAAKLAYQQKRDAEKQAAAIEKAATKERERPARSTTKALKDQKNILERLSAAFNGSSGRAQQFIKSIGRIALYRAIRTALKNITSAVKEGLTNLYTYSQTVGTAFAPTVDNLRQHVMRLKDAFASALRPAIEAILPVIIRLVDWLTKAADFIAQVMSLLTGKVDSKGRYTKAVLTDLKQSNKEAKTLEKTLRRSLLGFDEINRLDDDSSGGSSGGGTEVSGGLHFEQAEVSEAAKKWAERIQKVIDKVKEIGKAIKKVIDDNPWLLKVVGVIVAALAAAKLLKPVLSVISGVLKVMKNPFVLIAAYILASAIAGDKIKKKLDDLKKKTDGFFTKLKGHNEILDRIITFVQDILGTALECIGLMSSAIYKFVHGDTKGALEDLRLLVGKNIEFVARIALNLLNVLLGILEEIVWGIGKAVTWIHNKIVAPALNWLYTAGENVKIFAHNLWVDIKLGFVYLWRGILEVANLGLGAISDIINNAIETWNEIFGTDLKPVNFKIDTTAVDQKIEELKNTKLAPIKETVEVVGQWRQPTKPNFKIDTDEAVRKLWQLYDIATKAAKKTAEITATARNHAVVWDESSVLTYASGGFPSVGTVFVAGEAGPEYVGNIGGQTGVMNTDQMAAAMYEAMTAALANMPQQGGDIYLDGEVIYRNTVRRNNNRVRATGRSALLT